MLCCAIKLNAPWGPMGWVSWFLGPEQAQRQVGSGSALAVLKSQIPRV